MSTTELRTFIINTAYNLGFCHVGITSAIQDPIKTYQLNEWINKKYHASMHWMETRSIERGNIHNYFPEAKSIISLSMNYFTGNASKEFQTGKISNYAWGDDYHTFIKPRLYKLLQSIQSIEPKINGIICTDTSPVMEKAWAQKAGLGWIGKHTNLITRDYGSWIFLGEIIIDKKLDYDIAFAEDLCGSCTACLDACPTNAFPEPYILDSSKCISYLTIENKKPFSIEIGESLSGWIYGCDICQEVCPWNIKFSQISNEKSFQARKGILDKDIDSWGEITKDEFTKLFKNSAIKRTKFSGLKRNIDAVKQANKTNN